MPKNSPDRFVRCSSSSSLACMLKATESEHRDRRRARPGAGSDSTRWQCAVHFGLLGESCGAGWVQFRERWAYSVAFSVAAHSLGREKQGLNEIGAASYRSNV